MEKWPNFFIVGAPKAGTTSLYEYLKKIPGVYMSPVKEPNYFSVNTIPENFPKRPIRDKKKYLNLFEKVKDEKIVGEASPPYLSDPDVPKLIHEIIPSARILISLRDPVERLFSHYLMLARSGYMKSSFLEELKKELRRRTANSIPHLRFEMGLYSENVKKYLDTFGSKQVKILIFEEWVSDPKATIEEILRFLGLNQIITDFESEAHNPYVAVRGPLAQQILVSKTVSKITKNIIPRSARAFIRDTFFLKKRPKPKMDQESKEILVKFYHDDVQKLQTILGRKLPWPNF